MAGVVVPLVFTHIAKNDDTDTPEFRRLMAALALTQRPIIHPRALIPLPTNRGLDRPEGLIEVRIPTISDENKENIPPQ